MNSSRVLYSPVCNDECYTPDYAVRAIVPPIRDWGVYWCPFDFLDSAFVRVLEEEGLKVAASHIFYGEDFYTYEPEKWDCILSNPPFSNKRRIFERALSFNKPFALLMSLTWLNDAAPKQLFKDRRLELLMFEERIKYLGQGRKITFSSAYYCSGLLLQQITMRSLKPYGYK